MRYHRMHFENCIMAECIIITIIIFFLNCILYYAETYTEK